MSLRTSEIKIRHRHRKNCKLLPFYRLIVSEQIVNRVNNVFYRYKGSSRQMIVDQYSDRNIPIIGFSDLDIRSISREAN